MHLFIHFQSVSNIILFQARALNLYWFASSGNLHFLNEKKNDQCNDRTAPDCNEYCWLIKVYQQLYYRKFIL